MKSYDDMNYMEMDVIREVGSIGTGNAASALSSLLGTQVRMVLPQVTVQDFNTALNGGKSGIHRRCGHGENEPGN